MICINETSIPVLENNPLLQHSVGLISTESLLGEDSPYYILEESFLYEDPTVAEHLSEDLNIPLIDIFFHATVN